MAVRQKSNGAKTAAPPSRAGVAAELPPSAQPQAERLEAALREEERRYRTLVETNPVAIWQLNADGRLVYANRALAELLEFDSPDALLGEPYAQFFNSRDLKTVNRERERRLKGESSTYEVTVLGRLGRSTPVLLHGSPLRDESGQVSGVIGCLVDISEVAEARTELRKAGERLEREVAARTRELDQVNLQLAQELSDCERFEAALIESEKRYRQFSEMTSDYCYSVTVSAEQEVQSSWATASYEKVIGRTREEVDALGGWLRIVHPDDHAHACEFVRRALSNVPATLEYRIVRPDGSVRWLRDRVLPEWSAEEQRVTRIYGAVDDITDARAARDELQRQQEVLEQRVQERTNALHESNARLKQEIGERQQAEAQQRRISQYLRVVLAAADELLQCPDEDTLCRRAVELARQRLCVERASLFLFEADGKTARGTYGTNLVGRTTDERENVFQPERDWGAYDRRPVEDSPHSFIFFGPFYEWDEERGESRIVGQGEISVTKITSGSEPIGFFFNDQARTGLPLDPAHQQATALYCQWLGSVIQQQRANAARTQSDRRFRAVFDHALEPMVLADDEGRCLELNGAAEALLGLASAKARGRSMYDFTVIDGDPAAYWSEFLRRGSETGELLVRREDGGIRTAEYSATANVVPGMHLAVLRDVTNRRRTERFLAGQRRILEMVARATPLNQVLDSLILLIEEVAGGVRGSIHLCRNDELHGVSAPNLPEDYNRATAIVPIGEQAGSCGTAAFRRQVVIVKDIAKDRLWKDYRLLAKAHGLRACWSSPIFSRDGDILGTFALYRDQPGAPDSFERELVEAVTSLAGIAIERAQSEERLRLIESAFHHTHDAILIASAGGQPRTVYVNPAMAAISGYSLEELYRRRPGLLPGAGGMRPLAEALEQGESVEYSGQARRKDGSEYSAEWSVSPLREPDGAISHWVWVGRDVSARHRLEEQLRQSQKMDAIGRLAGGVAHDFNNLLAVIGGYSDLLLEEAEPGSRQRSGLEEIRKAAERAASLTRQLLAFARRDVVAPRSLDLNAIVTEMESMLRRLIGEDIEMQAILDPILPPIRVDAGQIEQVIMNLAVNARDAMPQGGRLTWETLAVEMDEGAAAPLGLRPATYVVLTASDTGIGIPDEVLPHIFEPFYTTKERGKGTGLGLATVYAIVTQNKGQIRVVSEPGCGARFEIYFPADKSRRPTDVGEPGKQAATPFENLTILLVEDEPQVRRLTAEVLRLQGHTVMEAERGDAALQFAAHFPGEIDLVLADVIMPGMNGREVAERLVRMRPETRVLYLSGYLDDSVLKLGVETDPDGFLQKPFTPEQLLNKIQERMQS